MGGGRGHSRGKPEGRGSWQISVRRKDTLGAEKGVFSLQSVPRCPFPQVKHGGPCGGFYFKFLLYFGHLLGCDSKLSKMQGKNSVAGAVKWREKLARAGGLCLSASSLGCSLKSVQTVSQSTDSAAKKYSAVEWGELPLPQARSSQLLGGWRATSRLCPEQRCTVRAGGAVATMSPMPQTKMLTCGLTEAGEALGGERDCTKMLFTPGSQRMRAKKHVKS